VNIRLSILFIALVVLPTSILSIMAASSAQRWEAMASIRREREGVRMARAARMAVDSELRRVLARVRERMAVSLAAGRSGEELKSQAARAETESPAVERVLVFMNPWGFLLPGEGSGARGSAGNPELAALEAALRRELMGGGRTDWVPVNIGGQAYVFGVMGEGGGLHVGYRVRQDAAVSAVKSVVAPGVDSDMRVVVIRAPEDAGNPGGEVVVSDPLGGAVRLGEEGGASGAGRIAVLAEARLASPLQHFAVRVIGTPPPEGAEAAGMRTQFLVWGVVLLGVALVAGVWITIRAARAEAVHLRNQADLVLGVSHDLRTPAASIRALAESLDMGRISDPGKQKRFISAIMREAERLGHLIERTLYLLRFEQGAMAFGRNTVDVRSLAEEAVHLLLQRRGLAAETGGSRRATGRIGQTDVVVRWALPDKALLVEGDSSALLQTISNLLDNAWQYAVGPRLAGSGGGAPQDGAGAPGASASAGEAVIELRAEPAVSARAIARRDGVSITVSDNGIGIRPGERRRLFRRFYRAPEARRLHASGVGLGLAFCRYVVNAHGGTLGVKSEFGKWSEFTVWLPCANGEAPGGNGPEGHGETS
jgi:signal transduction histidine kinase